MSSSRKGNTIWNDICNHLQIAFEGLNPPYIADICRLSRYEAAQGISWWAEGILEIIAELLNNGYAPKDGKEDYLFQAVALLERADMRGVE